MHRLPFDALAGLLDCEDDPHTSWLSWARDDYALVREHVPPQWRGAVEKFLATQPPPDTSTRVLCHHDLGIEHVLVDGETVVGIIDWGDTALADPARDLARIFRDLGPDVFGDLATAYGADSALRARARFHGRCTVFEEIAFGLESRRQIYVDKSLSALPWLFAWRTSRALMCGPGPPPSGH